MKKHLKAKTVKNMAIALSVAVASPSITPVIAMENDVNNETNEVIQEETSDEIIDSDTTVSEEISDEITESNTEITEDELENNTEPVEENMINLLSNERTGTVPSWAQNHPIGNNKITESGNTVTFEVTTTTTGSDANFGENDWQPRGNYNFRKALDLIQANAQDNKTYQIKILNGITLEAETINKLKSLNLSNKQGIKLIIEGVNNSNKQDIISNNNIHMPLNLGAENEIELKNIKFKINSGGDARRVVGNGNKIKIEDCILNEGSYFGEFVAGFENEADYNAASSKENIEFTLKNVNASSVILSSNNISNKTYSNISANFEGSINTNKFGINIARGGNNNKIENLKVTIAENANVQAGTQNTANGGLFGSNVEALGADNGNVRAYVEELELNILGTLSGLGQNGIYFNPANSQYSTKNISGEIHIAKIQSIKSGNFWNIPMNGLNLVIKSDNKMPEGKLNTILNGQNRSVGNSPTIEFRETINEYFYNDIILRNYASTNQGLTIFFNNTTSSEQLNGTIDSSQGLFTNSSRADRVNGITYQWKGSYDVKNTNRVFDAISGNQKIILDATKAEVGTGFTASNASKISKLILGGNTTDTTGITSTNFGSASNAILELTEDITTIKDNTVKNVPGFTEVILTEKISNIEGTGALVGRTIKGDIKLGDNVQANDFVNETSASTRSTRSAEERNTTPTTLSNVTLIVDGESQASTRSSDKVNERIKEAAKMINNSSESSRVASLDITYPEGNNSITGFENVDFAKINNLNVEGTVTIVGENAFKGTRNLDSKVMNKLTNITEIKQSAFENAVTAQDIDLPNSVTTIGNNAFKGLNSSTAQTQGEETKSQETKKIKLGSSIETIGDNALENQNIELKDGTIDALKNVGNSAFKNARFTGNATITFDSEAEESITIGSNAFEGATGLRAITLSDNITAIGTNALKGQTVSGRIKVVNPTSRSNEGITSASFNGVARFDGLTVVVEKDADLEEAFKIAKIAKEKNNNSTINIELKEGIKTINKFNSTNGTAYDLSSVSGINIEGVTTIEQDALKGINLSGLTELRLGPVLTTIKQGAFQNAKIGASVFNLPTTVTTIEANAFNGLTRGKANGSNTSTINIGVGGNITKIGANAFKGVNVNGLNGVKMVTGIDNNAFAGATLNRMTFILPDNNSTTTSKLTSILNNANNSTNGFEVLNGVNIEYTQDAIPSVTGLTVTQDKSGDKVEIGFKFPKKLVTVSDNAFSGIAAAKEITLGYKATDANGSVLATNNIGANAFNGRTITGSFAINGEDKSGGNLTGYSIDSNAFNGATLNDVELRTIVDSNNVNQVKTLLQNAKGSIDITSYDEEAIRVLIELNESKQDLDIQIGSVAQFEIGEGVTYTGSLTQIISEGKVTRPTVDPVKTGYTFLGWTEKGKDTLFDFNSTVNGKVVLVPKFEANKYTLTINNGDGTTTTQQISYDEQVTLPTPTREGYTFNGWYEEEGYTNQINNGQFKVTGNKTVYAKWTANTNTITFDFKGGTGTITGATNNGNTVTVTSGQTLTKPTDPTKSNLQFGGWYTDENFTTAYDFNSIVTGSFTLYAKWVANVTFDSDGGSAVDTQQVLEGTKLTEPQVPLKSGNIFQGWYKVTSTTTRDGEENTETTEENAYNFDTIVNGHMKLKAKWFAGNNLIFNTNGGDYIRPVGIESDQVTQEPSQELVKKAGHTFAGWYADEALTIPFIFGKTITSDTTIYAKWEINEYTVSFNSNDGSTIPAQRINYNQPLSEIPTPTRTGYTFLGWYTDEECTEGNEWQATSKVTGDTTLYAKWQENEYTVTFETNGGSEIDTITVQNGNLTLPENPTKTGYTFAGWYTDSQFINQWQNSNKVTANMTLYAKWVANEYTVTFETNGGTSVSTQQVRYDGTLELPTTTKDGYRLEGWYLDSNFENRYQDPYKFEDNITLYANWVDEKYQVTITANGGIFANGNEEVIKEDLLTGTSTISRPETPTRDGYTFAGWYTDPNYQNQYFTNGDTETFNIDNFADKTNPKLYAKWEGLVYTVTFESNEGTIVNINNSYGSTTVKQGTKLNNGVEPKTTRPGYTFGGWYTDAELTKKYDFDKTFELANNITLYAKWTKDQNLVDHIIIPGATSGNSSSGSSGGSSTSSTGNTTTNTTEEQKTETTEEVTTEANKEEVVETKEPEETKVEEVKELKMDTIKLPEMEVDREVEFKDVKEDHWAKESIEKLSKAGIINGTAEGEFDPTGKTKRADVMVMLVKLLGLEEEKATSNFTDVEEGKYYAKYVGIGKDYEIVSGDNGKFRPEDNISRQDTMVMVGNIIDKLGMETNKDTKVLDQFKDGGSISGYARERVAELVNLGIINGNNGNINPKSEITRAEMSVIIERLYDLISERLGK